jgi:proline utilization trans-activator
MRLIAGLTVKQCIVLATRPLVMWLLILNLQSVTVQHQQLVGPVAALLHTSTESAMSIVLMLKSLAEHDMLECFLPFQLEYAFSAAMLLALVEAILPEYVPDANWSRAVNLVFDEMIAKKNAVARLRKLEMEHLDAQLAPLRRHNDAASTQYAAHNVGQATAHSAIGTGLSDGGPLEPDIISNNSQQTWDVTFPGMDDALFNNHDQMLDLAEQFQTGDLDPSVLFGPG